MDDETITLRASRECYTLLEKFIEHYKKKTGFKLSKSAIVDRAIKDFVKKELEGGA